MCIVCFFVETPLPSLSMWALFDVWRVESGGRLYGRRDTLCTYMKFWFPAYALLFAAFFLLAHEWQRLPDDKLHIALLDVGQGDAILITMPNNQRILVDGGPDLL